MESPQQSIRFTPHDKRQISTIRNSMRKKGYKRIPPTTTEIVRFALEYAAESIRADRKENRAVAPPAIVESSPIVTEQGE